MLEAGTPDPPPIMEVDLTERELELFIQACENEIPQPRSQEVSTWLEALKSNARGVAKPPPKRTLSWPLSLVLAVLALGVALTVGLLAIPNAYSSSSLVSIIYLAIGLGAGVLGVCRKVQELAALGGILTKSLAWYLAPSLEGLNQGERFILSVALAAVLEYPFLTFSNILAFKDKTGMRLRAFQDFTDVLASFTLIAVAGGGPVDAFSITQTVLALVRVGIAFANPKPTAMDMEIIQDMHAKVKVPEQVQAELEDLFSITPVDTAKAKQRERRHFRIRVGMCISIVVLGVVLGVVGMVVDTGAYLVGIAAVFGMSLAWYIGPSLRKQRFVVKWLVALVFMTSLEYPFLSEANTRAQITQTVFELRAVQDVVGMVISTVMISILGQVKLNRYDALQLFVGFLRVLVATRFFFAL